jgi:L-amino acid N-acyltransferase YncA
MEALKAVIRQGVEADLDAIMDMQRKNQLDAGGALSAIIPRARVSGMMSAMPLLVADSGGRIAGFLMTSTRAMNADIPVIGAMFAAYPGSLEAHVYGPICIDAEHRGKGLAQDLFAELRRLEPDREWVLFIRRDNASSLRAHRKMGMRDVASFALGGIDYAVFSSSIGESP